MTDDELKKLLYSKQIRSMWTRCGKCPKCEFFSIYKIKENFKCGECYSVYTYESYHDYTMSVLFPNHNLHCPSCNRQTIEDGKCLHCCFVSEGYTIQDPCLSENCETVTKILESIHEVIPKTPTEIFYDRKMNERSDKIMGRIALGFIGGLIILMLACCWSYSTFV